MREGGDILSCRIQVRPYDTTVFVCFGFSNKLNMRIHTQAVNARIYNPANLLSLYLLYSVYSLHFSGFAIHQIYQCFHDNKINCFIKIKHLTSFETYCLDKTKNHKFITKTNSMDYGICRFNAA